MIQLARTAVGRMRPRWTGICITVVAALWSAASARAASLQPVANFGDNPSGAKMYIYVPDELAPAPAVLVALHYCSGTANAFFTGTGYRALADRHGFIVVYPEAPSADKCWDVHSQASLKHGGGSDSASIVAMVSYVLGKYAADAERVYVTGTSSGAMMTNVLLGAYPDVFKAGAAFAGVPYGCFAGTSAWNSACANGQVTKTAAAWGDLVRAAYPEFAGVRPRMQLWHGTADQTLNFNNFGEAIKQWTNVAGLAEQPTSTEHDQPQRGWTRTRYADACGEVRVEAIREEGQTHNLSVPAEEVVRFFGLDGQLPAGASGCADAGTGADANAGDEGADAGSAVGSARDGGVRAAYDAGSQAGPSGAPGTSRTADASPSAVSDAAVEEDGADRAEASDEDRSRTDDAAAGDGEGCGIADRADGSSAWAIMLALSALAWRAGARGRRSGC